MKQASISVVPSTLQAGKDRGRAFCLLHGGHLLHFKLLSHVLGQGRCRFRCDWGGLAQPGRLRSHRGRAERRGRTLANNRKTIRKTVSRERENREEDKPGQHCSQYQQYRPPAKSALSPRPSGRSLWLGFALGWRPPTVNLAAEIGRWGRRALIYSGKNDNLASEHEDREGGRGKRALFLTL